VSIIGPGPSDARGVGSVAVAATAVILSTARPPSAVGTCVVFTSQTATVVSLAATATVCVSVAASVATASWTTADVVTLDGEGGDGPARTRAKAEVSCWVYPAVLFQLLLSLRRSKGALNVPSVLSPW
jgi:hypothetical protein